MKDYDENVRKVMDTLSQYGYSDVKMKCYVKVYKDIRAFLEAQEPPAFLAENARAWCKSFVPKTSLARSLLAVDFLDDIYQHGRILGSHLRVPLLPTDYYSNLINSYLNSIEEDHACFLKPGNENHEPENLRKVRGRNEVSARAF